VLHLVRLQPYPQTLDQAGKLARDKHSSLFKKVVTYGRKKFYNIGHGKHYQRKSLFTVDLLIKIICFVKKIFLSSIKSN
jgi:hypothetical protein